MKTVLCSALRVVCALCFLLSLVEGSNDTTVSENGTTTYTGWHKGPAERGTMTILWSCLTTVFACTWTILHLNVPGRDDGTWRKILRKTKWMAVTVIFPEFIFAKAVCELQMAVEDLHDLNEQEEAFGWEVEYGRGCRILYWLFHPYTTSLSRYPARILTRRKTWTLEHCYFANMGGIVGDYEIPQQNALLTAHALVKCCVPNGHRPLHGFRLTKEEISDKSKADNLLKAVAALQILWLIVSVITRKAYDLPISLLEVCTVAFAALSIATYVANLAKPKDIDVPVILDNEGLNHYGDENFSGLWGASLFAQTVIPTSQHGHTRRTARRTAHRTARMKNDMLRLQAHGTQHLTLTYALAVSTICFGTIHCAAWQNYFPSQVERRLWQVSSVLSSTLPLTNLLALFTSNIIMVRKAHNIISTTKSLTKTSSGPTSESDQCTNLTPIKFWLKGDRFLVEKNVHHEARQIISSLSQCIDSLFEVKNGVEKGQRSRFWCGWYLSEFDRLNEWGFAYKLQLDDPPEGVHSCISLHKSDLSKDTTSQVLGIVNNSRGTMGKLHREWILLTERVNRISTIFAWLTGFLYATARLTLLALAFVAFRKQDERLYIDTWARFLPSIG